MSFFGYILIRYAFKFNNISCLVVHNTYEGYLFYMLHITFDTTGLYTRANVTFVFVLIYVPAPYEHSTVYIHVFSLIWLLIGGLMLWYQRSQ